MRKKRITLRDLAECTGFSKTTISDALNANPRVSARTRKAVISAAKRLGYRKNAAAKALVLQRSYNIGVVVRNITYPYFPLIIAGSEEVALEQGYGMLLTNSEGDPERERQCVNALLDKDVEGLIVTPVITSVRNNLDLFKELEAEGFPLVFVNNFFPEISSHRITCDNLQGGYLLTKHLLDHGYDRIGFIAPSRRTFVLHLDGYKKALQEKGLSTLIVRKEKADGDAIWHPATEVDGYEGVQSLFLKEPQVQAIFAANDVIAMGALKAIEERGLSVPHDVALVGFGDFFLGTLWGGRLTTVQLPMHEMGQRAMNLLIALMDGSETNMPREVLLPTKLLIRESCGIHA